MAIDVQTVLDTFDPSLFFSELSATDKDGVLHEIVARVCDRGVLRDAAPVLGMLRSREQLGSTGIGAGVAVPHGRSLAVPRLTAAFARHPAGVEWGAVDGEPVRLVFLILAPPLEQRSRYLPLLGRVVEAVSDAGRREQLARAESFERFQECLRDALA